MRLATTARNCNAGDGYICPAIQWQSLYFSLVGKLVRLLLVNDNHHGEVLHGGCEDANIICVVLSI
jgi:hypothetical protein